MLGNLVIVSVICHQNIKSVCHCDNNNKTSMGSLSNPLAPSTGQWRQCCDDLMKIELPSPRKPAIVTPKQGSLYHEMGEYLQTYIHKCWRTVLYCHNIKTSCTTELYVYIISLFALLNRFILYQKGYLLC